MKKIMSMMLAFLFVFSSVQVFAEKKRENIAYNCTFEEAMHEECLGGITPLWSTSASIAEGGANGSKGCLKIEVTSNGGYFYVTLPYQETIGETFDIYFWGRIDEGTKPMTIAPAMNVGHDSIFGTDEWTSEWKRYHFVYTNDGTDHTGKKSNAERLYLANIQCGDGKAGTTYYVDEIEIYPRGNIEYNEYFKGPLKEDVYPEDNGFDDPVEVKSVDYTDMSGHWAEESVDLLSASNYVQGMGDGTYAPEESVTKAQFITMAVNALRTEKAPYTGAYSDVTEDKWFTENIETAKKNNLINDALVDEGKFLPDQPITREEAASVIAELAKIKAGGDKKNLSKAFTDKETISDWAKASVNTAVAYGIINGYPDGSFGPEKNITRAEAASMLLRAIELSGKFVYYVDGEKGSDKNDGSINAPFKTIQAAKEYIQPKLKNMQNHIFVKIKGGDYHLNETVNFTTKDSGTNGFYVVYTSWGEEKPMFNMGKNFDGFKIHDSEENIYKTYVGKKQMVGEVYINDVLAVRATTEYMSNKIVDVKKSLYATNVAESILINPEKNDKEGWIICDNLSLLEFERPQDLEFTFHTQWRSDRCDVVDIVETEDGRVKILFDQANFYAITNSVNARATFPARMENAYELLDCEGEWYYNKDDGFLYYKPRKFENPKTIVATIPMDEQAFIVRGDSIENKAHNIRFENIGVEYTTWQWPMIDGNYFQTSDRPGGPEYKGDGYVTGYEPDAAFTIVDVAYIDVVDCEFARNGGNGLVFRGIFQYCNVIGNHIYDVGGTALGMGATKMDEELAPGDVWARYVQPSEFKYYKCYNTVKNNLIHDACIRYESGAGIELSFLKNSLITHNEIYNTKYMGITVGGGLNGLYYPQSGIRGLEISNNYIHDNGYDEHYDCGAIYFASPSGGSVGNYNQVKNNYLENHRQNYGTLYLDTAANFFEISGNVSDQREAKDTVAELFIWALSIRDNYIHDNFSTTAEVTYNQTDNIYEPSTVIPDANWPAEAQAVVDNSGLTPDYLEKYPDNIQRTRLLSDDYYAVNIGDKLQFEITAYNRKLKEQKLPYTDYNFYSSNEDVAVVDENGVITAVGKGSCNIYAEYLEGTLIRRKTIEISCEDAVINIIEPKENSNVIYGSKGKLTAIGITSTYSSVEIAPADVKIEDTSIISIDENGVVSPLKEGSTKVTLTFTKDDVSVTNDYNVKVVKYNQGEDTRKYLETSRKIKAGDPIFDPENWVTAGGTKAKATTTETGGITVSKANPSYCIVPIANEVISFDLTIKNPTTWPSLIFESTDLRASTDSKTPGDFYLFGISDPMVELQKFMKAKENPHVAIFGYDHLNPVAGPGFPNVKGDGGEMGGEIYNKGVTYSITVGTEPVEGGKKLIFLINGMPIYEHIDTDPVIDGKYLGVYNSSGDFTFEPFTDRRFAGY